MADDMTEAVQEAIEFNRRRKMNTHQIVARKLETLTPGLVRQWLSERLANCHRIASAKTGLDRDGWLEDAAYFAAAMGMVEWSELERQDRTSSLSSKD